MMCSDQLGHYRDVRDAARFVITEQTRTSIIALSVVMLGEAPGTARLSEWVSSVNDGMSLEDLANHIESSDAFQATYPNFSTNQEFAEAFLGSLMGGEEVSAELVAAAVDIVVGLLNDGMTRGALALAATGALLDIHAQGEAHAAYGDLGMVANGLANQIAVAEHYTLNARMMDPSSGVLNGVTSDDATVMTAIDAIGAVAVEGGTFVLTTVRDDINGTSGDDFIIAEPELQAGNLYQATLNPFDEIDGGEGNDTLIIYGVGAGAPLNLGAEQVLNVENVTISTVGEVSADLRTWEGLEAVNLQRFGRGDDVRVVVNGAEVAADMTFGGDATLIGASGAVNIAAGGTSTVSVGSAGHTESVMVAGGADVTVHNGAGKQSQTVSHVSAAKVARGGTETDVTTESYSLITDGAGFVLDSGGLSQATITIGGTPYAGIKTGTAAEGKIPLLYEADSDGEFDDAVPVTDAAGDATTLVFNTANGKLELANGGSLPTATTLVITPASSLGMEKGTTTSTEITGAGPTLKVLSDAIATLSLTDTDAIVLVTNDSKDEEDEGTPEDLAVTVDGYGKHVDGAMSGKLCLDGAGTSENVMIDVAGDSDFSLASDKIKALSVSGDGDLKLGLTEFSMNDDGGHDAAGSLETITLGGAGKVTIGLTGLSGLTMIDASASSGANKLTMASGADQLGDLETVAGGSGSDTVTLRTATNGSLESIDTGEGNDRVTVDGMHSRDGIEVNLGAGNDSYTGTAGNTMSRIDAGDGVDTLKLTSIANSTYKGDDDKQKSIYTGFETLDVGGSETGTYDMKLLGIVNDVLVSRSLMTGDTVTLKNMADGMGISVSGKSGSWPPFKPSVQTKATIVHELAERETGEPRSSGELDVSLNALGFANVKLQRGADLHGLGASAMGEVDLTLTTGEDIEVLLVTSNARAHTSSTVTDPSQRMKASDYVNKLTLATSATTAVLEELIVDGNARLLVDTTTNATAFASLELVDATDNSGGVKFNGSAMTQELELVGGSGKDVLSIGTGGGEIYGGLGGDSLTAGAGDDIFIIDDAAESQASVRGDGTLNLNGVDTITGFTPGDSASGDRIDLSRGLLNALKGNIKNTTAEWDDWMTDDNGANPVTGIDNDAVDRANGDLAAADLEAFIGNGNGLFESQRTLVSGQPGFSDTGDNTATDKYSIAVIAQTADNSGTQGLWLLFDVDGNGDFDADSDMVIFLAGSTAATDIDGDMFF